MWLALERCGAKVEACAACAVLKVQKATGTAEPGVHQERREDHQIRGKRSGISYVLSVLLRFSRGNSWKSATGIHQPWPMHPIAYSCTASHKQLWGWLWKHWRASCLGPCARVSIPSKLTFEIAKITQALHLFFHAQEMFQDVKGYSSRYL